MDPDTDVLTMDCSDESGNNSRRRRAFANRLADVLGDDTPTDSVGYGPLWISQMKI